MTPRREPLLWLQLIGLAAIPLELLLVLVLLAGSDPGRFPLLEGLLAWAVGAVGPAVLFWLKPPDPFSLLLLQAPSRLRRAEQTALAALPLKIPFKLLLASGALGLLPLWFWLDRTSVLATQLALLPQSNRMGAVLLTTAPLALLLWQWQQLVQSSWLLGRQPNAISTAAEAPPRLSLGLPILTLAALEIPEPIQLAELGAGTVAVEPEEAAKDEDSRDLDQPIP